MNSRSKKDNRSRNNESSGGARNNDKSGDKGRSNNRRRKSTKKKKLDPTIFWGDPHALPASDGKKATITSNPSAVVRSLGRPPLSGQQNAAEHYFTAVYDRAVNLAAALAAAGDLLEPEDPSGDDSF